MQQHGTSARLGSTIWRQRLAKPSARKHFCRLQFADCKRGRAQKGISYSIVKKRLKGKYFIKPSCNDEHPSWSSLQVAKPDIWISDRLQISGREGGRYLKMLFFGGQFALVADCKKATLRPRADCKKRRDCKFPGLELSRLQSCLGSCKLPANSRFPANLRGSLPFYSFLAICPQIAEFCSPLLGQRGSLQTEVKLQIARSTQEEKSVFY